MKRARIVIADEDAEYSAHLGERFAEELYEKIILEIITDRDCFESVFAYPQKIDILLVSEKLYSDGLLKHRISAGFILAESRERMQEGLFKPVYKYSNIRDIFSAVRPGTEDAENGPDAGRRLSKILMVTSASGGAGKTTVSMGIAAAAAGRGKRVLYINSDFLQHFQTRLTDRSPVSDAVFYLSAVNEPEKTYSGIRRFIRTELFDYVPPLRGALLSLGLKRSFFGDLADQAAASGDYDLIVVDADSAFDADNLHMMESADNVLVLLTQSAEDVSAVNRMISNLDISGMSGIWFACNKFEPAGRNALEECGEELLFSVSAYIEKMDDHTRKAGNMFSGSQGIRKLSMLLI